MNIKENKEIIKEFDNVTDFRHFISTHKIARMERINNPKNNKITIKYII